MIIHTVQPDETINSIAEKYGVSADKLIIDNRISDPNRLVPGQTLTVLFPKETYQVQDGDNLADIAALYGISMMQLLRNNPQLFGRQYIYPGEELVISLTDEKIMEISTNGYALPFIDSIVLRSTLPYLTYLTIFSYRIARNGELVDIDDQELIHTAREYGVAPIMLLSTLTNTLTTDVDVTHSILTNLDIQEHLISSVLDTMKLKGYYGLNIDMQNIVQEEKQLFVDFVTNISSRARKEGYVVFITITPSTFVSETGFIYQGPEYAAIGQLVDSAMLLSYEWGRANSTKTVLPIAEVRARLDYSVTQIPPEKTNIGLITIGYVWELPFDDDYSIANAISHDSSLLLARDVGVAIQHDVASEAPYFSYITDKKYIVWFRDVRSIANLLELVVEYGLEGIGTWQIMQFASGVWVMINAKFEIRKVL